MSSIDKYVRTYATEVCSEVSVSKRGGMIIGTIRGREVFRIPDRYGYLSDSERTTIRNSIHNYRKQVEAELKQERERREREERQAAERAAVDEISGKLSRISEIERSALAFVNEQKEVCTAASARLTQALQGVPLSANADALAQQISARQHDMDERAAQVRSTVSADRRRLEQMSNAVKGASKAQCESYRAEARRMGVHAASTVGSVRFDGQLSVVENNARKLKGIADAVKMLVSYVESGEAPASCIEGLTGLDLCDEKAVNEAIRAITGRLDAIAVQKERSAKAAEHGELVKLQQSIAACRKLIVTAESSSYEAHDYSAEIERAATEALSECAKLRELGYCVLGEKELRAAEDRIVELARGINSEGTLDSINGEIEKARSAAARSAVLEKTDYAAYLRLKGELAELGVDQNEIPDFNANDATAQLAALQAKRDKVYAEGAPARLALCEQQVQIAMEACGYRLLTGFHDAQNRVWENIFAIPEYPDVVYQVVYFPDGSFRRRLLGVNRCGDTQTSMAYLRAVARELENSHEADDMIAAITGGEVTKSVNYSESITDEELTAGGYFYIENAEQLAAYEKAIAVREKTAAAETSAPTATSKTKRKHKKYDGFTTVDITDRSSAVKSSTATLRAAAKGIK